MAVSRMSASSAASSAVPRSWSARPAASWITCAARRSISTTSRFFVLDEADEMLDMGFIEDIEWILEQVPAERQTALFSATMPPRIAQLASRYMNDPERISVAGKQMTVPQVTQAYYEVPRNRKIDALTRILDAEDAIARR